MLMAKEQVIRNKFFFPDMEQLCICRTLILRQLGASADCRDRGNPGGLFRRGKGSKEDDQEAHHNPCQYTGDTEFKQRNLRKPVSADGFE